MEGIIDFALDPENGVMFAPTAYYFMQTPNQFSELQSQRGFAFS